jgi:hypothetical protein
MYYRIFFTLALVLIIHVCQSQTIDLSTSQIGWVITVDSDSIQGNISISSDSKSLMVTSENRLTHYRAGDVQRVRLGSSQMIQAKLEFDMEMRLFLVLVSGKMTILFLKNPYPNMAAETNYYLLNQNVAEPIVMTERQFFKLFKKQSKTMWSFAFSRNLDLTSQQDIETLFDYYNSLPKAD